MPGPLAVQCFFMISGFYMALVLNEKYTHRRDYWLFLQQRFLRIHPSYLIILSFYLLFFGASSLVAGRPLGFMAWWTVQGPHLSMVARSIMALINVVLLGSDYTSFLGFTPDSHVAWNEPSLPGLLPAWKFLAIVPVWSLGVEIVFYALAPLLVRRTVLIQLAVFAIFEAARWVVWLQTHIPMNNIILSRLFPLQLPFFMAGSLGYVIYRNRQPLLRKIAASHRWLFWLFPFLVIAYSRLPHSHHLYWGLFLVVFLMIPLLFTATKSNRVDRLIGELSFPFYLGHMLSIAIINQIARDSWPRWGYGPAYLALTLLFSWLFYRFIESNIERFRARLFVHERTEEAREDSTAPSRQDWPPISSRREDPASAWRNRERP